MIEKNFLNLAWKEFHSSVPPSVDRTCLRAGFDAGIVVGAKLMALLFVEGRDRASVDILNEFWAMRAEMTPYIKNE